MKPAIYVASIDSDYYPRSLAAYYAQKASSTIVGKLDGMWRDYVEK